MKRIYLLTVTLLIIDQVRAPPPASGGGPGLPDPGNSPFHLSNAGAEGSLFGGGPLANIAINSLDPCKYFENITDVQQLNHHEYVAFEQCLYYFLANRAQHQAAGAFGAIHPIATLPPSYGGPRNGPKGGEIRVRVGQITIQHFQLNEFLKDLHIVGYLEMQWDDQRLSWDQSQFKVEKLQIHSANHIWMPILSSQAYETSLRNDDAMEVRRLESTSRGNVSAIVTFSLKTFCDDTDFRHFPDDVYKCCFLLEPHFNQELIEFTVDGQPVFTDPKYFRDYGWSMSGTIPTVNPDPNVIAQLNFCINLQRSSSAVKIEMGVPTWATAILFLFSPLFGPIRNQLYFKLFLLLIQLITLQLFSNRIAPHLGSASATPVIVAIHELAIVLNVISIIFSMVVWMFASLRRDLPPWGWLTRLTQIINKFIFVFNSPRQNAPIDHCCYFDPQNDIDSLQLEKTDPTSRTANGSSPVSPSNSGPITKFSGSNAGSALRNTGAGGRYQADWIAAFMAIHSLGVTFLSLIFIFGYLVIR
ncbi:neurotransmitter-gated ion-channel ligand binding domain-containing protein [Ditylenchus destructor]|uniref:Neurotransmitter-gated ion-channel ligand binding domain-containing protein n=1 Tax=Ditylenchus destructor TaxID=166010 RepID=A0AAD4MSZ7_9BILA|nr:neurotransmitter-gated ion-channel ligand binding domain-containing protein [Ditylenchus destructor]